MTEQHSIARCVVAALSALAALTVFVVVLPQPAFAQPRPGTTQSFSYGAGQSAHPYIVYTPRGWSAGKRMPLLVVLHGCQTSAYQQMEANLYNPLADTKGFVVVYPDTDPAENAQPGPLARCWQFFNAHDWKRGPRRR